MELLEHKHLSEQDYFVHLLRSDPDQALVQEAAMLSQQQRKDRLHEIKNRRLEVPPGNVNSQLYKSFVFLIVLLDIPSFAIIVLLLESKLRR